MRKSEDRVAGSESTAAAGKPVAAETIVDLYSKSVERIAEVQKKAIDLAVRQNTELLDACKKIAQTAPATPGLFMLDLAANAFERLAETQKGAIDLVLEQTHSLAGIAKERVGAAIKAGEGASSTLKQTVEQSLEAQKKALDYSASQSKAAFKEAKQKFGLAGTPAEQVAESFERGVESLIQTQKELLDMAAKPFGAVN